MRSISPAPASASPPPALRRGARRWWCPTTGRASRPRTGNGSSCASSPRAPAEGAWASPPAAKSPRRTGARSRCATALPAPRSSSRFPPHEEVLFRSLLLHYPPRAMKRTAALALALGCACNTDSSAPHLARGNVLVNTGHREEALAEYREAARLSPRSGQARERLGDTLYDLDRKEEALAAYRDAAGVDPDSVTARIGVARVLGDKGDLASARAELGTALQRAPTNLFLLLSRGNLAARAGDRKAALADYERAVHLKSDNVPALYQYGLALLEDGQVPEAAATFDRLVQVSPASPQGHYGRARVFAARGEGAPAAAALAEQGLKGEALDKAAREAADRSLAQMQDDAAFSRWSRDPEFRRTAWR